MHLLRQNQGSTGIVTTSPNPCGLHYNHRATSTKKTLYLHNCFKKQTH